MKTKKEIEQLAEQRFPINQNSRNSLLVDSGRQRGFEEGYTQSQEDMTDKIKELESEDGTPAYYYIRGYMDYQLSLKMLTKIKEQ